MPEGKESILVVEDDMDLAEMLTAYFQAQGYQVMVANWGEEAVKLARSQHPDLVILDIRLPDIDGFEVARRLRAYPRTSDIPIIFLTEKRDRADRLQGLELGADDYLTKPFDIHELRLRVRNSLKRRTQGALTNPVTKLPEETLVDERLTECLQESNWALLQVSIQHLGEFREVYGFVASDDVQRAISLMLQNAVQGVGNPDDFIGQLSPNDFILVTTPAALPALAERIRTRLEQSLDYFYPLKDRTAQSTSVARLAVRLGTLTAAEGAFDSPAALRAELSRRLQ